MQHNEYKDAIVKRLDEQTAKGIAKYGNPLSHYKGMLPNVRLEHLAQELTDALVYVEHLKEMFRTKVNDTGPMDLQTYQRLAQRTARTDLPWDTRVAVAALGLAGETGEVVELVKKFLGHKHSLDSEQVKLELSDIFWYVAELCELLNIDIATIPATNIAKLKARYPEGFDAEVSKGRYNEQV